MAAITRMINAEAHHFSLVAGERLAPPLLLPTLLPLL
jgi:hypothetical protein